jgi:hypothetical protein
VPILIEIFGQEFGAELPFQVNPPPPSVLILFSQFSGDVPQYDLFPYGTDQNGSPFRSEERKCQSSAKDAALAEALCVGPRTALFQLHAFI